MANTADTGSLIFGEDSNESPEPFKIREGSLVASASGLKALTNASINATIDATKVAVRLDTTISAVAGSSLRLYSSVDCWIAWGATESVAEDAASVSAGVAEKTADDGFFFAKGTEIVKVPTPLTGQIWIGAIRATANDGSLNIALID